MAEPKLSMCGTHSEALSLVGPIAIPDGGNDYYVITEPGTVSVVSDGSIYHVLYLEGIWTASA